MAFHAKPILAVLALACGASLWVTTQAATQEGRKPVQHRLSEGTNGKERTVKVGDTISVTLPSNPSTGYSLVFLIDGSEPWTLVRSSYRATPVADGIVGSGGSSTFVFRATKPGQGVLAAASVQKFNLAETLPTAKPWSVNITVTK